MISDQKSVHELRGIHCRRYKAEEKYLKIVVFSRENGNKKHQDMEAAKADNPRLCPVDCCEKSPKCIP
jgi:hypothetical protein